jgi:hypothetical protein
MGNVESLSSFLLAGSKHFQYLWVQPSEYVDFPYAGWWKERGKEENPFTPSPLHKGILCWLVEKEIGKGKEKSCLW